MTPLLCLFCLYVVCLSGSFGLRWFVKIPSCIIEQYLSIFQLYSFFLYSYSFYPRVRWCRCEQQKNRLSVVFWKTKEFFFPLSFQTHQKKNPPFSKQQYLFLPFTPAPSNYSLTYLIFTSRGILLSIYKLFTFGNILSSCICMYCLF